MYLALPSYNVVRQVAHCHLQSTNWVKHRSLSGGDWLTELGLAGDSTVLVSKKEREMGLQVDYEVHRTSVDIAKGYRQIQKAATAMSKGKADSVAKHLDSAVSDFDSAISHAAKATDDVCKKAGTELNKGNTDLQKSIQAYRDGNADEAQGYYDSAVSNYDKALDMLGNS